MNRRTFIASLGATRRSRSWERPARRALAGRRAGSADGALAAVMDRIFFHLMDTNPEFATALGLDTGPRGLKSQLSDYSPASQGTSWPPLAASGASWPRSTDPRFRRPAPFIATRCDSCRGVIEGLSRFLWQQWGRLRALCDQPAGRCLPVDPDFLDQRHPVANAGDADAYLARLRGLRHGARPE